MRLRNVKNAKDIVENSEYVIQNPVEYKGRFNDLFGNKNPIRLEIGMGKGNFILDMAKKNPKVNFIGVEKYQSIVCRAIEKAERSNLSNVKFICVDEICWKDIVSGIMILN